MFDLAGIIPVSQLCIQTQWFSNELYKTRNDQEYLILLGTGYSKFK